MNLSAEQMLLMQLIFLAKNPKPSKTEVALVTNKTFSIPKGKEWDAVYESLREMNILDKEDNLTKFGVDMSIQKRKGINFEKEATRDNSSIMYCLHMAAAGFKGLIKKLDNAMETANQRHLETIEHPKFNEKLEEIVELESTVNSKLVQILETNQVLD